MTVAVEKNVKMWGGMGRPAKYPWRMLEIGDSFVSTSSSVYSLAYVNSAKLAPKAFKVRKEAPGVFRVWRTQ